MNEDEARNCFRDVIVGISYSMNVLLISLFILFYQFNISAQE